MAYEYRKLKARIVEVFGTQGKLAEALGITETTVSSKMNGHSEFSKRDMEQWGAALKIAVTDFGDYFFT